MMMKRNYGLLCRGKNPPMSHGLKVLYYVQIYSYLNHFKVLWGNMVCEKDLNRLRVQQNKCVKLLCKRERNIPKFNTKSYQENLFDRTLY